jgi:hypothetical protein
MTTELPPRERLAHVVRSLLRRLPEDHAALLDAERFAEGRAALARLAAAGAVEAAVAATAPAEAAALADRLLERWGHIGEVRLEPHAAILGPEEIWLGEEAPREIAFDLAVSGLAEGWSANWSGEARPDADGRAAVLELRPEAGADTARLAVRVIGRGPEGRCILAAGRTIPLRRPRLELDAARRRLLLRDQHGRIGARVEVTIAGETWRTSDAGILDLPAPLPLGAEVTVGGAALNPG